ncbi:hypothetical protein [Candidatus Coxiella mudrowiae]|uniref:hypothetical protein n=1 Tax=Candidatus Coxiella mudrowiae TaxID=2054173 RepID=UPI002468159D|nr:hypothetical protein [Candidatus Coxiella mudrowiae]
MKKIAIIGSTFVLVVGLAGVVPRVTIFPAATITIAGTAAGRLLGAEFFHGEGAWIGILGSTLVGGVIVNLLGNE